MCLFFFSRSLSFFFYPTCVRRLDISFRSDCYVNGMHGPFRFDCLHNNNRNGNGYKNRCIYVFCCPLYAAIFEILMIKNNEENTHFTTMAHTASFS